MADYPTLVTVLDRLLSAGTSARDGAERHIRYGRVRTTAARSRVWWWGRAERVVLHPTSLEEVTL